MKSHWSGHAAVTRQRLLVILERAASGAEEFSVSERALFTACEFWAAVESRTLKNFLGRDAAEQLRYAAVVYEAIGANDVAQAVEETLESLLLAGTENRRLQCIAQLQERLHSSTDPLDDLIARFAARVH